MQIPLEGGYYRTKSVIAGAQRCLNLYPERNQAGAPFPYTTYLTPGLTVLAEVATGEVRGEYTDSAGRLWVVIGDTVYWVDGSWGLTSVGTIATSAGPVVFKDNRLVLVLVDGSEAGYAIDFTNTMAMVAIAGGGAFYGANVVDYLDTFFLFNKPNSNVWYISLSEVTFANLTGGPAETGTITAGGSGYVNGTYSGVPLTGGHGDSATATIVVSGGAVTSVTLVQDGESYRVGDVLSASNTNLGGTGAGFTWTVATVGSSGFDALDFVAMTGANNAINGFKVVNRQIWTIGDNDYGEIWYNEGTPDFTFGRVPGVAIQHGCAAIYSLCQWDLSLFWLGRDDAGNQQVYQGLNYTAQIITPPAVSAAISGYAITSDAIGYVYQQNGHVFYVLTFPTADATWVYDVGEKLWHERAWIDSDGTEHRHRSNCQAFAYGVNVVGDFANGKLYKLDPANFTDNDNPIVRRRGFPHVTNERKRLSVSQLVLNMAVGQDAASLTSNPPMISVRASTTQGASWRDPRRQSLGSTGQYGTDISFRQWGIGRDWVFEVFWDCACDTALNGGYLQAIPAGT